MMEPIDVLSQMRSQLAETRKELQERARLLIDGYWASFTLRNKEIATLYATGQSGVLPSNIAPVIEERRHTGSQTGKIYIVWKSFSKKFRTNITNASTRKESGVSLPIHSYAATDVRDTLKRKCSWNVAMATELETNLIPIRHAMNTLHECEKRLLATERKLNKEKTQGESHE